MSTLLIEGGHRLEGRVAVEGNKNAALPLLAACLLTEEECVLTNVPRMIGVSLDVALQKHFELMIFGGLIIFFLIVEPLGLARLWQITKEKLRLWPFPH